MTTRALCVVAWVWVAAQSVEAAGGSWTGTQNSFWTNAANWSTAPYPGAAAGESARFDGNGGGNTTIDLSGLPSISRIDFDSAAAAAYTLGAGGPNAQTLVLENSGVIAVSKDVSAAQTIPASVVLGTTRASATYTVTNNTPGYVLTLSGSVSGAPSGGTAGAKTLNLSGVGSIVLSGVLSNGGATGITLNSYGTNTLSGNNTFSGNITVTDGALRLKHSNALGSGAKSITAANNINGRNPSIVLDGSDGDLTIPATVTFVTSQSRAGAVLNEAGNNTILGNFTLTSGDGATHIWSKAGKLTLAGRLTPNTDSRQLYLRGDGEGEISGVITNGGTTAGLPLYRDVGSGTWTLSGSNTYSGSTTVSAGTLAVAGANGSISASSPLAVSGGGALVVSNTAAANHADRLGNAAAITLSNGTLAFVNDGSAANFAETVGAVSLSSGTNRVLSAQAAENQTSVLTLSGLSRSGSATVDFVGVGIGTSDRNRIFIAGQPDGLIGSWATINGVAPAFYSSARGVYLPSSIIAAKGDVLVDGSAEVVIQTEGSGGPDALSAAVTSIGSLLQNSAYTSTVDTAAKTLRVDKVTISPLMANLTLGLAANDGTVTPATPGGELALANNSDSATLAVNAAIADNAAASPLSKSGTGKVLLTGTSTYSGQTWVRAGTLGAASIGSVGEASSLGQPTTAGTAAIKLGFMSTNVCLLYTGSGQLSDRALDLAGTIGTVSLDQSGTGLLKLTGGFSYSGSGGKTLYLQGSTEGAGELAGIVSEGWPYTNKLVKTGTGQWTLSATNAYRGETEINQGTLTLANPTAIPPASLVRFSVNGSKTGALELAHDGANETRFNVTIGTGNYGTILSGSASGGVGIDHVIGDLNLSYVTLTVARASNILSGSPAITAGTLDLSSGSSSTVTLNPTSADLHIGRAAIFSNTGFAKTLRLDGSATGNTITGAVYNSGNTVSLAKEGPGTWTLSGSNTYSGATTVNAGTLAIAGTAGAIAGTSALALNAGTLRLSNGASANNTNRLADAKGLTLNGGTLDFSHAADGADYSETLGPVAVGSGSSTISASQADATHSSTLALSSLQRPGGGALNFSGTGLGEDARNRILIANQPSGLIGFWTAYNGGAPAMYDVAKGVYGDASATVRTIAARGPGSVVPSDAFAAVRIDTEGTNGPVALEGASYNPTFTLLQTTAVDSQIDVAGKTLATHGVGIAGGAAALTVGLTADDGVLTALAAGGKLELGNESSSALTVNAAVSNNAGAVSLAMSGVGDVVLNGTCSYSGDTLIQTGNLVFASCATQALVGAISGAGNLVKAGTNLLTLAGRNTFTGVTLINAGTVLAQTNLAFGASSAGTVIASGATLDVGANLAANALTLGAEVFTVSGSGVGGRGAIVNNSGTSQYSSISKVVLAGHTTFGGAPSGGRFDIRSNTPTLAMNDFTLTKVGPNTFGITSAAVTPGTGCINVVEGVFRLESSTTLGGSATNVLTLRSGTSLEFYRCYPQCAPAWTLVAEDSTTYNVTAGGLTLSNNWAGPVVLNGALRVTGGGNYAHAFGGPISGTGSLIKYGTTTTYLTNDFNTYSGYTWVTNGTLYLSSIRAVGSASSSLGAPATPENGLVRLGGGSSSATLVYTGAGDTSDRVLDLSGTTGGATLNQSGGGALKLTGGLTVSGSGTKTLTLTGSTAAGAEIAGAIVNSSSSRVHLTKSGTGTWTLSGNNSCTGDVAVTGGDLVLAGGFAQGPGAINVSGGSTDTVLGVAPGANLTGSGGIRLGNTGGSSAALYMTGGSVNRTPKTGDDLAFTVGRVTNSFGYFAMSGGNLVITRIQTGATASTTNNATVGNVRMTGGTVTLPDYILLGRGPGSLSSFTLDGGTLFHTNAANNISIGYDGGSAIINLTGGALESYGRNLTVRQNVGTSTGIVNFCAGSLSVDLFQNTSPGVAVLNFAGGTLKAGNVNSTAFIPTTLTGVYSYGPFGSFAGGSVIDTLTRTNTVALPIRAPTGNGVYGIALSDPGSGFIGEPYVLIEGDGSGATAVANLADDGTSNGTFRVASITVTCPGANYVATPTVRFLGGGSAAVAPTVASVSLAANASGGLTKLGTGTLVLGAANTYTGATAVAVGTLKLGTASALSSASPILLAGGTLDLGGFTVTNAVGGAGTLTNGTIQATLSPAGAGAIGTNSLVLANASVKGTYVADVAPDGSSDRVNLVGSADLSSLTLTLVDPGLLERRQIYTVLSATGTVTGKPTATNLPEKRWHVATRPDGRVLILFSSGTVFRVQ